MKIFQHISVTKSSSADLSDLQGHMSVHVFGTSVLKSGKHCIFLNTKCSLTAGEKHRVPAVHRPQGMLWSGISTAGNLTLQKLTSLGREILRTDV